MVVCRRCDVALRLFFQFFLKLLLVVEFCFPYWVRLMFICFPSFFDQLPASSRDRCDRSLLSDAHPIGLLRKMCSC
uniref:Putative secreted protein n=1 Tax=Anopheles darlingi TaxID=43151 RepID=A0A2M4DKM9_ANODA